MCIRRDERMILMDLGSGLSEWVMGCVAGHRLFAPLIGERVRERTTVSSGVENVK